MTAALAVAVLFVTVAVNAAVVEVANAEDAKVAVSEFDSRGLTPWRERRFEGSTDYTLTDVDGRRVLEARARGSASGLYRRIRVDPAATPRLHWCWWVAAPVSVDDVRVRSGDDFAARVYVVFSGGLLFWNTTSLVYVWADADAPVEPWRNPFTRQAAMVPLRHGGNGWRAESRDVGADYRRVFGRQPPPIVAVAIMTDTDQTGVDAHARYAALRFSAAP